MDRTIELDDDFFKKLNTDSAYRIKADQTTDFWKTLRKQLGTQVIQEFGIQDILDRMNLGNVTQYKEGGDVSTVHNADNGVFVDDKHQRRYQKAYNRKDYEGRQTNDIDNRLKTQRKEMFQNSENIKDAYTGKQLEKDGSTHLDHVTSAKHIHDNKRARLYMTDDERNDMAVDEHNMAPIDGRMNQSKGEDDVQDWANKKEKNGETKAAKYDVDEEKIADRKKESEKFINRTVNKSAVKEFNSAAKQRGMQQAKRQACGVAMYMATDIVIDEMTTYVHDWKSFASVSEKVDGIKATFKRIQRRLWERLKQIKSWAGELIGAAFSGFTSGVIGTLISTLINSLTTTISAWGKILQDGLNTFVRAFKMLVTNPKGLSKGELTKAVLQLIGIGFSTSIGLVIGEKVNEFLVTLPGLPKFLMDAISTTISAVISGCLSALVIVSIDNFGRVIRNFKLAWDDFKQGIELSMDEVKKTYNEALQKVDESYHGILLEIETEYEKMGKLASLAHDVTQLASNQLFSSVIYARASGVPEKEILHDNTEVSDYFLGGK